MKNEYPSSGMNLEPESQRNEDQTEGDQTEGASGLMMAETGLRSDHDGLEWKPQQGLLRQEENECLKGLQSGHDNLERREDLVKRRRVYEMEFRTMMQLD